MMRDHVETRVGDKKLAASGRGHSASNSSEGASVSGFQRWSESPSPDRFPELVLPFGL